MTSLLAVYKYAGTGNWDGKNSWIENVFGIRIPNQMNYEIEMVIKSIVFMNQ